MGGKLFFWVFLLPCLFPSSGVLTADPRSALSSLWLCSFHLHNWLSPRAFIHADKSFWHVHGVCTARARPGARRSAAFSKTARLGQPAQPPHAGFIFFFWCEDISARSSSPRSGYSARAASPSPAGSKAACSRRTQQCDLHSWPPRKAEGDPRGGWCHFSAVSLLQGQVTPVGHGGGPGSMRPRRWGP